MKLVFLKYIKFLGLRGTISKRKVDIPPLIIKRLTYNTSLNKYTIPIKDNDNETNIKREDNYNYIKNRPRLNKKEDKELDKLVLSNKLYYDKNLIVIAIIKNDSSINFTIILIAIIEADTRPIRSNPNSLANSLLPLY